LTVSKHVDLLLSMGFPICRVNLFATVLAQSENILLGYHNHGKFLVKGLL